MKSLAQVILLAGVSFAAVGGQLQTALAQAGTVQAAAAVAPVVSARQVAEMQAKLADWPQLQHYRAANAALPQPAVGEDRVVFYGASITEDWGTHGSSFFPGKQYVNRGISGQTSAQMVVRFRQDVIDLHPKAVVILEGTNDIAGNTGPMTPEMTEENWESMAELAKANGIQPIFASITPSTDFPWRRGLHPEEKIRALNAWLKEYCAAHSLVYLDYYSALVNAEGGMKAEFTVDGVHATVKGYEVMAPLAQAAIDKALAN
jgi:lysophospholipase L1-like esterase